MATTRSKTYLALYALASGGGAILYVPLLTLLLPLKAGLIAPTDKLALLGLTTIFGAVAASIGNIVAGEISDRTLSLGWGRRIWAGIGLALIPLALWGVWASASTFQLVCAVTAFQLVLNILLSPLVALAADEVPDAQKGFLGGLIGAAYPFGALAGIAVTASPALSEGVQLAIVAFTGALAILPFLVLSASPREIPAAIASSTPTRGSLRNLIVVGVSRLMVQIASLILFTFFLFYFESIQPGDAVLSSRALAGRIAWLAGLAAVSSVPLSLMLGRLSDRAGWRRPVMMGTAAVAVAGLVMMAALPQWHLAALGYLLFACSSGVFLALQTAQAMQVLPSPSHRGRDLGFLNLANTLPSILGPWLAVTMVAAGSFRPLMLVLAALTALAAGLMLLVKPSASIEGGP